MRARHQLSPDLLRRTTLTTAELHAAGISKDSITRRTALRRVAPGIYVVSNSDTWGARLAAGLAIGGPDAAAHAGSALALHGLAAEVLPVQVLVPTSHPRSRDWVEYTRGGAVPRKILRDLDPPRVGLEDAVLDQANESTPHEFIALLTRAFQERRTTVDRLRAALAMRTRQRHRRLIDALLDDASGIHSLLEHQWVVNVERAHHLEPMTRQFFIKATGHHSDGAHVAQNRLIELDGVAYHDPVADRDLDNRHAMLGWTTLRFGWDDCVIHPCRTARIIDPTARCRKCR